MTGETVRPAETVRDWTVWALALLAALAVAVPLLRPAPAALIQQDSAGYLAFDAARTAGYPLLLRLVEQLPGGLDALPGLQLAAYGAAALCLALAFRRLAGSRIAAGLLLLVLLGNPQVTRLSFMVMTEAPFLACLALVLALVCRLLLRPRWQVLALVSLVAGIAVLIRPAGYALVMLLPLVAFWSWRDGLPAIRSALAAALPYLVVLGCGMVAYHAAHGSWRTQNFLAKSNLFGKAAAIADPALPVKDRALVALIAVAVAPDRAMIDRAPGLFGRYLMLTAYYDAWHFRMLPGPIAAQAGIAPGDPAALDAKLLDLAVEIIAADPLAYLGDAAQSYAALWWMPDALTHAELARFDAFLAAAGPLPDIGRYPDWHQPHSDLLILGLRGFMLAALASSLWWAWRFAVSLVRRRRQPPLDRLGAACALAVHASFVLTALLQAGIPRYVWALWPALAVLVVAGATALATTLRRRSLTPPFPSRPRPGW